jgi:predicted dehydrogenase
MITSNCVRLAVVGGGRGSTFSKVLGSLSGKAQLVAVCDHDEAALQLWKEGYPEVRAYNNYEQLLDDDQVDAVFLATPLFIHASQAIQALQAGKHVISEVIAITTLEEGWELIEAVEKSGLTYMMAENYCFMRPNMMIQHMVQHGLFGELVHVEGGYIHDIRNLTHYTDGKLTWRGNLLKNYNGNTYPTHSLGPVAKWLDLNRNGEDQFDSLSTFVSTSLAGQKYYKELFGEEHPGAGSDHWQQGDSAVTMIRTKKGVLITLRYDVQSSRPHNMTHYALQGTKGAYLSSRHDKEQPLIWLDGESPGMSADGSAEWESLWKHADEWEHPLWKTWGSVAEQAGHGGGDFFVLHEFISAILEGKKPAIDVYDAVMWSSVFPLSVQSAAEGGKSVKFVDFWSKRP